MKRPFHYSLFTLLLVTTIVAMAFALYITHSRMREVQADADRLKSLFGEFSNLFLPAPRDDRPVLEWLTPEIVTALPEVVLLCFVWTAPLIQYRRRGCGRYSLDKPSP